MNDEPRRFQFSIASPSEIERTARELAAIREEYLATGIPAVWKPRPSILDSWQRCRAMHVDPTQRRASLAITREPQLRERQEASAELMRAAGPVIRRLGELLAGTGYAVALADAEGCILDLLGDEDVLQRLARSHLVPGSHWSEAAAGTNAIGTTLADGHVVQLMAAEHYCSGWQDVTCTAAPIRHPLTREIIGVLDLTGDYRLIRSHLTSLVAAGALEIGQELRALLQISPAGAPAVSTARSFIVQGSAPRATAMQPPPAHRGAATALPLPDEPGQTTLMEMRSPGPQERRVRDAELLVVAGASISASLDLEVTLETVTEQAAHLLRLDSAAVCLLDETGTIMARHIWYRPNPPPPEAQHKLESLLERTRRVPLGWERGESVMMPDVFTGPPLLGGLIEPLGPRSAVLLPLAAARGVIGMIYASPGHASYDWSVDDMRLGLGLTNQAALAIENARLFNTLQQHTRHVEALNAAVQLLGALPDPGKHLDSVLERIVEIMDLEMGMVFLLDQDTNDLMLVAHRGLPEAEARELLNCPWRPPVKMATQVAATGESLLVRVVEEKLPVPWEPGRLVDTRDLMAVPLAAGSALRGVLLVGSRHGQELKADDLTLFEAIGQHVGLVMENALLLRTASEMDALREADRLKDMFLAAVSHDLRSPLTAIRASVEGLLDHGAPQSVPEQEHLLRNIEGQAGRLERLVDRLLDLSRIEAGALPLDRDWIELPALIVDSLAKFQELESACRVEQYLAADLPLQYVDPDRLVEVLWNLLENACKYTPPASSIRVEATCPGSQVLVAVADRGPGIPQGEREKIFQHFYRLDRDRKARTQGSGVGLAICRGIVEAHGGRIWVEDRPGGGSVFRIALPVSPTDLPGLGAQEENDVSCDRDGAAAL
jgi:two-component system sensor histidine kinase KdpD